MDRKRFSASGKTLEQIEADLVNLVAYGDLHEIGKPRDYDWRTNENLDDEAAWTRILAAEAIKMYFKGTLPTQVAHDESFKR